MRHNAARRIIVRLLQGQGFGEQAIALTLIAAIQDRESCPPALTELLDGQTDEIGTDSARPYHGTLNQAPIPRDERELCAQLLPAVIGQPADIGVSLAGLATLALLWPHVSNEERPLIRIRFLNGLASRRCEPGAEVSRQQLCDWQRNLPTAMASCAPCAAGLQQLITSLSAEGAYRCLAEHLDPRFDLRTLTHVLGTLTVTVLRQYHDRNAMVLHVLLGANGLEQLAEHCEPDLVAVALAQLAHQLWWCRQRAHLPLILTCIDPDQVPLRSGVASGDVTLAQRSARTLSQAPSRFWPVIWELLTESVARRDEDWPRAVSMVSAIAFRAGHGAVSPDDAAALATVMTDMVHHRDRIVLS